MSLPTLPPKALLLSRYLFGILSIYTIYGLIYQRLVMSPFVNTSTGQSQYMQEAGGLVFFQQLFAWMCLQVYAYFKLPKQVTQKEAQHMPRKKSFLYCLIKLSAMIMFTEGLYATNYRFALMVRSGVFVGCAAVGVMWRVVGGQVVGKERVKELGCGLVVLGGMVLFWVLDPEINYYVPIQPRVIGTVLIIVSVLLQSILYLAQSQHLQAHNLTPLHMQRNVSIWTMFFAYMYVLFTGKIDYSIDYGFRHIEYLGLVAFLALIYFIGQLIIHKTLKSLGSNVVGLMGTATMVLMLQISYAFTVHSYERYQVVGLVMAWGGLVMAVGMWVRGEDGEGEDGKGKTGQIAYDQILALDSYYEDQR